PSMPEEKLPRGEDSPHHILERLAATLLRVDVRTQRRELIRAGLSRQSREPQLLDDRLVARAFLDARADAVSRVLDPFVPEGAVEQAQSRRKIRRGGPLAQADRLARWLAEDAQEARVFSRDRELDRSMSGGRSGEIDRHPGDLMDRVEEDLGFEEARARTRE